MNYYDIDEQIREDASYDDYDWNQPNRQKQAGKKLPVVAVYPDGTEKVQGVAK